MPAGWHPDLERWEAAGLPDAGWADRIRALEGQQEKTQHPQARSAAAGAIGCEAGGEDCAARFELTRGLDRRGARAYSSAMRTLLFFGGILFAAALPALAHHALASEFRTNQTIMLTGTVTKVEWSNPHARLYMEAKQGGELMKWNLEMASPNMLILQGWKIDTFRKGDRVTVDAYPSRDGSNRGYATKVAKAAP